jgi:hypothetical protein
MGRPRKVRDEDSGVEVEVEGTEEDREETVQEIEEIPGKYKKFQKN